MAADDITIAEPGLYRTDATLNPAAVLDAIKQDKAERTQPDRRPLTRKQRITYDALVDYIRAHGYPPSVRDLADILDLSSTSTVTARLHALRERGWITMEWNKPRAITIVDA